MAWLRHRVAYIILVVGLAAALFVGRVVDQRDIARNRVLNRASITRNCQTGQRAYDALVTTVKAAYAPTSLQVDPATLPEATQQLLAALEPLLRESADIGTDREQTILDKLGPRPKC